MAFSTSIIVRFGDCDPAGIVYFATLLHYCEVAFEDCWAGPLGRSYPDLIRRERIGFAAVHVESDFVSPARHGDRIEMRVWVSRVGTSSVVFEHEGLVGDRRVFRASLTRVCTDLREMKSIPVPDWMRERLLALAD